MHQLSVGGIWRIWAVNDLQTELGEPMFRGPMNEASTGQASVTVVRWNCSTPDGVKLCSAFSANVIGGESGRCVLMMPCDRHSHLAQADPI